MLLQDFSSFSLFLSEVSFLLKQSHLLLHFLIELGPLLEHVHDRWELIDDIVIVPTLGLEFVPPFVSFFFNLGVSLLQNAIFTTSPCRAASLPHLISTEVVTLILFLIFILHIGIQITLVDYNGSFHLTLILSLL
jgi:hypothetical protein